MKKYGWRILFGANVLIFTFISLANSGRVLGMIAGGLAVLMAACFGAATVNKE